MANTNSILTVVADKSSRRGAGRGVRVNYCHFMRIIWQLFAVTAVKC